MLTDKKTFDALASTYDERFSDSITGFHQRMVSRKWLNGFLKDKKHLKILEINCGTGDDAWWLSSLGHQVVATDASAKMIDAAKKKTDFHGSDRPPVFFQCDFANLEKIFAGEQFDLVFSNFAGLNCISPAELHALGTGLQNLSKPGGYIAAVIFGKYCLWELLYFLFRMQPRNACRRWSSQKVEVVIAPGVSQDVYYYSKRNFLKQLAAFITCESRPVGLFLPPSYLEAAMQKRKRFFSFLAALEKLFGRISFTAPFADHRYLLLKKLK